MSRKVIVTHDESETFTRSTCPCSFCLGMHASVLEWDRFVPETNLQRRMKETVATIENRTIQSLRRSPRIKALSGNPPLLSLS